MKTVMKKMFSLLLVAVLLVSAVPAAFAAETCPEGAHTWGEGVVEVAPSCTNNGRTTFTCTTCGATTSQYPDPVGHTPGAAATCAAPQTCTVCGGVLAEKDPTAHVPGAAPTCSAKQTCTICGGNLRDEDPTAHNPGPAATCVAPQTCTICGGTLAEINPTAHKPGPEATCTAAQTCTLCNKELAAKKDHTIVDGHCTTCSAGGNNQTTQNPERKAITWQVKNAEGGSVVRSGSFTPNAATATVSDILYYKVFEKNTAEQNKYTVSKVWSSKDQKTVATNGTIAEGDTVTFVLIPKQNNSSTNTNQSTGSSKVKVHVNIHNGGTYKFTKELYAYNESPSTSVHHSISKQVDNIVAELAKQYPGYAWAANRIFFKNIESSKYFGSNDLVGDGVTVYIDAYGGEDDVYIYVYNARTNNELRVIPLRGKQIGNTITLTEVTEAVKKYFHVSSLQMYDSEAWSSYVDGSNPRSVESLTIKDDLTLVHVKISGSAKSGTSYTADSSNPKTGDAIFAPVMIMGASVTALAVLFYLNKKRAY